MENVVVGLDLHKNKTQGTIMSYDGAIIKQERFDSTRECLAGFLHGVPQGTKVALESVGFCWPWIDTIESLGHQPLLANPAKVKYRAEEVKTDKVDSELLANLTRTNWLPTCYVPSQELRQLRSLLRHRFALKKQSKTLKIRTKSDFAKKGIQFNSRLDSKIARKKATNTGIFEVKQNMDLLDLFDQKIKELEKSLENSHYYQTKPVKLLQKIPGIGLVTSLTLYAEICDITRFSNPEKLAHYCGLVPKVNQSGDNPAKTKHASKAHNKTLKWLLIEAAWSHIRYCPEGRLAKIFAKSYRRTKSKTKAIKIVSRKLVNIIWAVWTYGREFDNQKE